MKAIIVVLIMALFLIIGCNWQDQTPSPSKSDLIKSDLSEEEGVVSEIDRDAGKIYDALIDSSRNYNILMENRLDPNVAAAVQELESLGYTYVARNSLVMIQSNYLDDPNDGPSYPVRAKLIYEERKRIIWADTIVWLAFENPTHDSANHTALITNYHDGHEKTIYMELNVGSIENGGPTSQGIVISGTIVPQDMGMDGWWGCVAGGVVTAGIGCLSSNCGWAHCTALWGLGALVGCTIASLW